MIYPLKEFEKLRETEEVEFVSHEDLLDEVYKDHEWHEVKE